VSGWAGLKANNAHLKRSRSQQQLIVYRKCNLEGRTAKRSLSFFLSNKRERAVLAFKDLTFSILSTREPRQHHRIKKKTLGARRLFPLLRRALTSGLFCDPMLTMVSILWKGFLSSNASIICRPLFFLLVWPTCSHFFGRTEAPEEPVQREERKENDQILDSRDIWLIGSRREALKRPINRLLTRNLWSFSIIF